MKSKDAQTRVRVPKFRESSHIRDQVAEMRTKMAYQEELVGKIEMKLCEVLAYIKSSDV